jgi:SAM-dependent methyltransferase
MRPTRGVGNIVVYRLGQTSTNPGAEDDNVDRQVLLDEISSFCRQAGMAETTFGRRAVNDGKLISRLRFGGRVTTETLDRVRAFMSQPATPRSPVRVSQPRHGTNGSVAPVAAPMPAGDAEAAAKGFRFYDNRQKYLSFVTTCGEKWAVADRVSEELANIHPRPPALRVFDAGTGEGTVLTRVMRSMHARFPTMPFYIVGKEISLEDIRLVLEKMADRFYEHPATVLVLTNMYYAEAPWLKPRSVTAATSMVWHEERLRGTTSRDFEEQITRLQPFLSENWTARVSKTSGNPVYEKPVVLVLYRDDYRFLLDHVRPRRGVSLADYDLVIASQPYRARASAEFKASKVLAPLARALAPGGRLIGIHSHGGDPGLEIVRKVWPGETPFTTDRHTLLRATKVQLGRDARDLNFNSYADNRALFRFGMHTLPSEISGTIGTSTLFAAWNAAIYVAQIEDERLSEAVVSGRWLEATSEVLREHRGLWFCDESYVISRKRDVV